MSNCQILFGFFGEGRTVEEAKQDFQTVFNAMRAQHKARTGVDIDVSFEFVYDIPAPK